MGIRIQPREIKIPVDSKIDPFDNDLLVQKEPVYNLMNLIGSIVGPCTIQHYGFNHCNMP